MMVLRFLFKICKKCIRYGPTNQLFGPDRFVASSNRLLSNSSFCLFSTFHQHKSVTQHALNQRQQCGDRCYTTSNNAQQNGLSKAVSVAEKLVGYPTSFLSLRCLLSDELSNVALHMRKLVGTNHPLLKTARGLVFDGQHNLQTRGLLVMLISKAAGPNLDGQYCEQEMVSGVYPSQRSLAEITEIIHTANVIHKGVVNLQELQPEDGSLSGMEFGNKMAVLSGDYLLASACTELAKLGNPSVVEQVASSIGDMMTAEFTNFTDASGKPRMPESCGLTDYLKQTYLSLGSLLAKSCLSSMLLAGHLEDIQSMAFSFGENITFAQQLSRDVLPFINEDEIANLTLTSGPLCLYREQVTHAEFGLLEKLWEDGPANYRKIVDIVSSSGVVDQCKELCISYRDKAIASLDCFNQSEAKDALINMVTVMSDFR